MAQVSFEDNNLFGPTKNLSIFILPVLFAVILACLFKSLRTDDNISITTIFFILF